MPEVPQYNHKPLRTIYNASEGSISLKQKNLIITLCERRKISIPDFKTMTRQQAAEMISNMLA